MCSKILCKVRYSLLTVITIAGRLLCQSWGEHSSPAAALFDSQVTYISMQYILLHIFNFFLHKLPWVLWCYYLTNFYAYATIYIAIQFWGKLQLGQLGSMVWRTKCYWGQRGSEGVMLTITVEYTVLQLLHIDLLGNNYWTSPHCL